VDFTREPIIETVVTPREGCKLVVRSSKSTGQEEYFVDAVEIVSFGHSFFFRSLERPKMFFVPATDYEILEVREARMVLKNVAPDRTIKIGGGREPASRQQREREPIYERVDQQPVEEEPSEEKSEEDSQASVDKSQDLRTDKKKERRRQSRRRRGGRDGTNDEEEEGKSTPKNETEESTTTAVAVAGEKEASPSIPYSPPPFTGLLAPPPMLISDTIARYRENAEFKDAFYSKEEQKVDATAELIVEASTETALTETAPVVPLELSQEQEESIYLQRKAQEELEPEASDQIPNHEDEHNHNHPAE